MKKILTILLFLCIATVPCFAQTICSVSINGEHVIENKEDLKSGAHTFVLTGEAPMPADAENGIKKVTISSNEKFDFGVIDCGWGDLLVGLGKLF